MKLWIDDIRPAPDGYIWCSSVDSAKKTIEIYGSWVDSDNNIVDYIELIDIDHDAADYSEEWLEGDY